MLFFKYAGADCKSASYAFRGSNPRPTTRQSVKSRYPQGWRLFFGSKKGPREALAQNLKHALLSAAAGKLQPTALPVYSYAIIL